MVNMMSVGDESIAEGLAKHQEIVTKLVYPEGIPLNMGGIIAVWENVLGKDPKELNLDKLNQAIKSNKGEDEYKTLGSLIRDNCTVKGLKMLALLKENHLKDNGDEINRIIKKNNHEHMAIQQKENKFGQNEELSLSDIKVAYIGDFHSAMSCGYSIERDDKKGVEVKAVMRNCRFIEQNIGDRTFRFMSSAQPGIGDKDSIIGRLNDTKKRAKQYYKKLGVTLGDNTPHYELRVHHYNLAHKSGAHSLKRIGEIVNEKVAQVTSDKESGLYDGMVEAYKGRTDVRSACYTSNVNMHNFTNKLVHILGARLMRAGKKGVMPKNDDKQFFKDLYYDYLENSEKQTRAHQMLGISDNQDEIAKNRKELKSLMKLYLNTTSLDNLESLQFNLNETGAESENNEERQRRKLYKGQEIKHCADRFNPVISIMIASRLGCVVNMGCKSGKDRQYIVQCMVHALESSWEKKGGDIKEVMNSKDFCNEFALRYCSSLGSSVAEYNCVGARGIKGPNIPGSIYENMDTKYKELIEAKYNLDVVLSSINKCEQVDPNKLKEKYDNRKTLYQLKCKELFMSSDKTMKQHIEGLLGKNNITLPTVQGVPKAEGKVSSPENNSSFRLRSNAVSAEKTVDKGLSRSQSSVNPNGTQDEPSNNRGNKYV